MSTNAQSDETLREALDRLALIRSPASFGAAWSETQQQYNHAIKIIESDRAWLNTFNCYAFALGMADHPRYQGLVQAHGSSALANSRFVMDLLARAELVEMTSAEAAVGSVVLYFAEGLVQHAAVMVPGNNRYRSKWGPNELCEHGLWEVQQSYGDGTRFFAAPDAERVLSLLERHLTSQRSN